MIRLQYNMNMPETCSECPLMDEEFCYCHGRKEYKAWELSDLYIENISKPKWCPLTEVLNETERNN